MPVTQADGLSAQVNCMSWCPMLTASTGSLQGRNKSQENKVLLIRVLKLKG